MHGKRRAALAALVVFVAVTCLDAAVLYRTRDRHLGVHEDHFDKGVALHETGAMSSGSTPSIFRPPGYPVFVAAALAVRDTAFSIGQPLFGDARPSGARRVTVLVAHAALLGLLGGAIFWFSIKHTGAPVAAACAVAVACNPLLVVIAGFVSYPLLHIVLLAIATLTLLRGVGRGAPGGGAIFRNGLIWGVATLVKSVTLVAPAFVLLWAALHYGVRAAARTTVLFAAGLLLVVAPWTARNYVVTERFIPVNAQASFALWATSLERIPPGENYLNWVRIWTTSGMTTYTDVTGAADYHLALFEEHALELGDRLSVMTADNLRRDPKVYAYNVVHNSFMFIVESPTTYWFGGYQFGWPGRRPAQFIAGLSFVLMTVISVAAILAGCVRRDPRWTLLATLYVMMLVAHAFTFLEARYLYIKLPTIIAAFVFACAAISTDGGTRWRQGVGGVAALTAVLSVAGLLAL